MNRTSTREIKGKFLPINNLKLDLEWMASMNWSSMKSMSTLGSYFNENGRKNEPTVVDGTCRYWSVVSPISIDHGASISIVWDSISPKGPRWNFEADLFPFFLCVYWSRDTNFKKKSSILKYLFAYIDGLFFFVVVCVGDGAGTASSGWRGGARRRRRRRRRRRHRRPAAAKRRATGRRCRPTTPTWWTTTSSSAAATSSPENSPGTRPLFLLLIFFFAGNCSLAPRFSWLLFGSFYLHFFFVWLFDFVLLQVEEEECWVLLCCYGFY